jgi:hypothetical protein
MLSLEVAIHYEALYKKVFAKKTCWQLLGSNTVSIDVPVFILFLILRQVNSRLYTQRQNIAIEPGIGSSVSPYPKPNCFLEMRALYSLLTLSSS